jgi:hypothetical protein
MKFLVDANRSPKVAAGLVGAGFDAIHVADLELLTATEDEILDRAIQDGLVVITADSDFGMLLALRRAGSDRLAQPVPARRPRSAHRLTPGRRPRPAGQVERRAAPGAGRPRQTTGPVMRVLGLHRTTTQPPNPAPVTRAP